MLCFSRLMVRKSNTHTLITMNPSTISYPPWFSELKREIASSYPDFETRITRAWKEVIEELTKAATKIHQAGSDVGSLSDFPRMKSL